MMRRVYTLENSHVEHKHGRFGRWCSFPNGWFLGSILSFRGVSQRIFQGEEEDDDNAVCLQIKKNLYLFLHWPKNIIKYICITPVSIFCSNIVTLAQKKTGGYWYYLYLLRWAVEILVSFCSLLNAISFSRNFIHQLPLRITPYDVILKLISPQKSLKQKKIQPMKTAGDIQVPKSPISLLAILAAPVQLKCLFKIRSLRPGFSPPFWAWSGFKYKTNHVIQQFFFKKNNPKTARHVRISKGCCPAQDWKGKVSDVYACVCVWSVRVLWCFMVCETYDSGCSTTRIITFSGDPNKPLLPVLLEGGHSNAWRILPTYQSTNTPNKALKPHHELAWKPHGKRPLLGQPFPYDPISMLQLSFAKLGLYTSHGLRS